MLVVGLHRVCSIDCGLELSRHKQEKKRQAERRKWSREAREFRAQERQRKATIRDKKGPARRAQDAVNAFILVRDHFKPCIVHGHGCPNTLYGWHAGHFQGVGKAPELRYNTWNIHKQCAVSNSGAQQKQYYRNSVDAMYEQGLIARIGAERVAMLKGPHPPKQYRAKDFERITRIFLRREKHYRKLRGL
jgi:hypothetical protein